MTLFVTCNSCSHIEHLSPENCSTALLHEETHPGHQVTVWDSFTSQIPRSLWAVKA